MILKKNPDAFEEERENLGGGEGKKLFKKEPRNGSTTFLGERWSDRQHQKRRPHLKRGLIRAGSESPRCTAKEEAPLLIQAEEKRLNAKRVGTRSKRGGPRKRKAVKRGHPQSARKRLDICRM